jgi:hypothetical protein
MEQKIISKKIAKTKGSTDLNESHVACEEHTKVFVKSICPVRFIC